MDTVTIIGAGLGGLMLARALIAKPDDTAPNGVVELFSKQLPLPQ